MTDIVGTPGSCAACGANGWTAHTSAGEIVIGGDVVATVPPGANVLLVGERHPDRVYCVGCPEED